MLATILLLFSGIAGFLRFSANVSALENAEPLPPADGIVVLTGGKARIETALDLLAQGKGRRLLISGVHPRSTPAAIRAAVGGSSNLFDCCVDFDRAALDTSGNAAETGKWAHRNGFATLIIVTSDYHMPRSLMEMRRYVPDIRFVPYFVRHETVAGKDWFSDHEALRLIAAEYLKYLAASIRSHLEGTSSTAEFASAVTSAGTGVGTGLGAGAGTDTGKGKAAGQQ